MNIDIPTLLTGPNQIDSLINIVKQLLPILKEKDIYINLDIDLPPYKIKQIMEEINNDHVGVVYNVEYMTFLGYDHIDFMNLLEKYIRSIIISDYRVSGVQYKLGDADAPIEYILERLRNSVYKYNIRIEENPHTRTNIKNYIKLLEGIL